MFTISYISSPTFFFIKKENCIVDYLLSFNVDVCIIPTCTCCSFRDNAKLITTTLLKFFGCYFRFLLFKFAFSFLFVSFLKIKGYGDATNPSLLYYLAQDILVESKGNIFQSFSLVAKSMIAKTNKSNKDQSSLFDHPAIGLILFDHFLLLMKKTQWSNLSPSFWNQMVETFLSVKDLWFHWTNLGNEVFVVE